MKKYRKKPVVVEAMQWLGLRPDGPTPMPPGVYREPSGGRFYVTTMHLQRVYLEPGDWIIREPDGEHYYPCKAEVFAASYETAGDVP